MRKLYHVVLTLLFLSNIHNVLAQETTTEANESLWTLLSESAKQKAKETAKVASNTATELTHDMRISYEQFSDYSQETFESFMHEVDKNVNALEMMGYSVTDLYLGVDLNPHVAFRIRRVEKKTKAEQQAILEQVGDGLVLSYIVEKLNSGC